MSEFENALQRLDDELHGQNYELYVYLHDVISGAEQRIEELGVLADPLTKDLYKEMANRHTEITLENKELRKQLERVLKDAAFYKCCALSGEIPKEGSEPSAQEQKDES